jgi:hypothetical protein
MRCRLWFCCISDRTNLKASFLIAKRRAVYDTCTINWPVMNFWNLWIFVDSVTYSGSTTSAGSNPTLTAN